MSNYILNPKYKNKKSVEIFNALLNSIKIGEPYHILSGNKHHKVIKITGEVIINRIDSNNNPKISFDEFINVIDLFKLGKSFNTASKAYKDKLKNPVHKTPLLSILLNLDIIKKIK